MQHLCMEQTSLPKKKITFYMDPGHPRPQIQLKGILKKTVPGTTAAPSWNPHTQPGLTSFPPRFLPLSYTSGIITQSKAGRLFQLQSVPARWPEYRPPWLCWAWALSKLCPKISKHLMLLLLFSRPNSIADLFEYALKGMQKTKKVNSG